MRRLGGWIPVTPPPLMINRIKQLGENSGSKCKQASGSAYVSFYLHRLSYSCLICDFQRVGFSVST